MASLFAAGVQSQQALDDARGAAEAADAELRRRPQAAGRRAAGRARRPDPGRRRPGPTGPGDLTGAAARLSDNASAAPSSRPGSRTSSSSRANGRRPTSRSSRCCRTSASRSGSSCRRRAVSAYRVGGVGALRLRRLRQGPDGEDRLHRARAGVHPAGDLQPRGARPAGLSWWRPTPRPGSIPASRWTWSRSSDSR